MRAKKRYSLIFILMVSFLSFGQTDKSELITFKNKNFIKSIENILSTKKNCAESSNNHNWYIEKKENGSFIVAIGRIGNLLQNLEEKELYTTVIGNKVMFYITQKEDNLASRTGYFIDLNKYVNLEYVLFEDFSSWLIMKDEKKDYVIKGEKLFKCNY